MPRVRSEYCCGDVHELYAVPSSAHWNVRSNGRLSVPSNVKSATCSIVGLAGPVRIRVFGGVTSGPSSTCHSWMAGGSSTTPSGFVARTANSYMPFTSVKYTAGELHGAHSATLNERLNVVKGWSAVKMTLAASLSRKTPGVDASVVTSAGTTANAISAGLSSTLRERLIARTRN